jgi:hypothetical protein
MQSRHKCAYFLAACVVAAGVVPARASVDDRHRVDISGGRLSAALAEFARETGAELLFNQQIVSGCGWGR